jgi:hypothetical protein
MESNRCLSHAQTRLPLALFTALFSAALLCGCSSGGKLVPVTGTVKLDGQPVEGANIIFWSTEPGDDPTKKGYGLAVSDASGKFVVKDFYGKEGLFTGEYKVTFNRYVDSKGKLIAPETKPEENVGARNTMPKAYQSVGTTTEIARVPSSGLEIVFDLRSR